MLANERLGSSTRSSTYVVFVCFLCAVVGCFCYQDGTRRGRDANLIILTLYVGLDMTDGIGWIVMSANFQKQLLASQPMLSCSRARSDAFRQELGRPGSESLRRGSSEYEWEKSLRDPLSTADRRRTEQSSPDRLCHGSPGLQSTSNFTELPEIPPGPV